MFAPFGDKVSVRTIITDLRAFFRSPLFLTLDGLKKYQWIKTTKIFLSIDVLFLSIDVCFERGGTVFQTAACHAVISPETSSRVTLASLGIGFYQILLIRSIQIRVPLFVLCVFQNALLRERDEPLLQFDDFITVLCRLQIVHIACRLLHFLRSVADAVFQLLARHSLDDRVCHHRL